VPGTFRASTVAGVTAVVLLLPALPAAADDAERLAMQRVRLTTEVATTQHCSRLGSVRDDSVKDLRRKIVKSGGDTALLVFGVDDLSMIYADVLRCPAVAPLPPGVPPPPPGPPPAPPPGAAPPR
jgi:hypothetical protein